jgi:hypothetical protein
MQNMNMTTLYAEYGIQYAEYVIQYAEYAINFVQNLNMQNMPSGFLPGTTSYVYVRCRTYTVRHRTSDVRCRFQHRTYDVVRTMSRLHTTLNIRHRTFVNIVGATYDIVGQTYDIVRSMKCMSYAMSYVPKNLRHRRFVNLCRIRCRRSLSYTMS